MKITLCLNSEIAEVEDKSAEYFFFVESGWVPMKPVTLIKPVAPVKDLEPIVRKILNEDYLRKGNLKGAKSYTNGISNRNINPGDAVPEGFFIGRIRINKT